MKRFTQKTYYILLIFMSLTACQVEVTLPPELATLTAVPETTMEPTAVVLITPETATPTQTPSPSPSPTATQTLIPTTTPTATPSPTPDPIVRVGPQSELNINVRSGPGTNYSVVSVLGPGQAAVVTGRNEDQNWWQISLTGDDAAAVGWIFAGLVEFEGNESEIKIASAPPPPLPAVTETENTGAAAAETNDETPASAPEDLAQQLDCGKDFCVTYQAMVPIWENGGCVGNHSIYITVLEGLPPGKPLDGVVIGDTFNNVEVASGSHGPGRTEITLWNNSMILVAKRHIDGAPFTSEESFNFTAHDELIPAEVLAANGYCEGRVDICEQARNNNQVCRGHYSWRVTFHKFN